MNFLTRRTLARAGVSAAAFVAAVGAFAAPAYADTTADLEAKFAGTTIAADAQGKFGNLSIINHGPSDATGVVVTFDLAALDPTKVGFPLSDICTKEGDKVICSLGPDVVKAGADLDLAIPLEKKAGATGSAGRLIVSVASDATDPRPANNSVSVDVTVGGKGPDLSVFAPDVYQLDENGDFTDKPVHPGGTTEVWVFVINQGDVLANGIKITVKLPAHVTFTETEPACTHAVGDSQTTCAYSGVVLIPADQDHDPGEPHSFAWFFWPVKVADNAPAPASLTGGVASADAISTENPPATARSAAPANMTDDPPVPVQDVDPTDNTDEFTVFTDKEPAAGGTLPITGVKAGLIVGVGAAALALGGVLFGLARRRRVVTVLPADE